MCFASHGVPCEVSLQLRRRLRNFLRRRKPFLRWIVVGRFDYRRRQARLAADEVEEVRVPTWPPLRTSSRPSSGPSAWARQSGPPGWMLAAQVRAWMPSCWMAWEEVSPPQMRTRRTGRSSGGREQFAEECAEGAAQTVSVRWRRRRAEGGVEDGVAAGGERLRGGFEGLRCRLRRRGRAGSAGSRAMPW